MKVNASTPRDRLLKILNDTGLRRNAFNPGSAPGVGSDSRMGFEVGSLWVHGGVAYVCTDSTPGAAVWSAGSGGGGSPGADGDSAYEVAVANGFVGDEAAWLASLVGPQGPQGPQGIQGETGAQGEPGAGGLTDAPSDGDSYARRNAAWIQIPRFLTYVKPTDTTKNSDIVWADDPHLVSETLVANAVYRVELMLLTSSDAATDLAFRIQRTGLSDANLRMAGDLDNAAAGTFTWANQQNIAGAGATNLRMGNYIGFLQTGTNTGTIAVQWRQQTSGAGNSTLRANSMMMLRRVS